MSRLGWSARRCFFFRLFSLQVCYLAGKLPPVSTDRRDKCRQRSEQKRKCMTFALYTQRLRTVLLFLALPLNRSFCIYSACAEMALYGTIVVGCFGGGLFPRFVTVLVLENSPMMYQNGVLSCSLSKTGFQGELFQCFPSPFHLMLTEKKKNRLS